MKHFPTVQQIKMAYNFDKEGRSKNYIARKLSLSVSTVTSLLMTLDKNFLSPPTLRRNKNYTQAVQELSSDVKVTTSPAPPVDVSISLPSKEVIQDRFSALDEAFKTFESSLETFILAEVDHRIHFTAQELERVQQENEELKKTLEGAKTSNFVTNLKKKWGE